MEGEEIPLSPPIIMIIFLLILLAIYIFRCKKEWGGNAENVLERFFRSLILDARGKPFADWFFIFKEHLNKLPKAVFEKIKMAGVRGTRPFGPKISRGPSKLADILFQAKREIAPIGGRLVSLCAGRLGWESLLAPMPGVEVIESFTLGASPATRGHEEPTSKPFPGRHKVIVIKTDVTCIDYSLDADWLFFDGGESKPKPEDEAARGDDHTRGFRCFIGVEQTERRRFR